MESGIQKCFLVNLESWLSVVSGIQLKESGIPVTIGIRNPSSTDKNRESSPWSQESVAWNRQSKTVLDFLIWQSDVILSVVYSRLRDKKYGREFFFFMKKANRFKLTIGKIRKGDSYVYFDNSRSLVFQFLVDNDLIHPYDEWDAFFHCRIKTFFHLYDSVELTTSQRPSLSIEHSFGGAIYPFIAAKKRIFRAYTSQVWVWSIWKHC